MIETALKINKREHAPPAGRPKPGAPEAWRSAKENDMRSDELIRSLRSQSTWRLLGLGVITYGVYFAYYVRSQSLTLNKHLSGSRVISTSFTTGFMVLAYLSLALFIPYILVDEGHPIELISGIIDLAYSITLIVWGFKARNRINMICEYRSDGSEWFNGFWTFLFTPLYFNYKVNILNEKTAEHAPPAGTPEAGCP